MRSLLPWPWPRPRTQKPHCSRRVRLLPSTPTPSLQRPLTMTSPPPWPRLMVHVSELRVRLSRPSRRYSLHRPPPPAPLGMPWAWEPPLLRLWTLLPRLLSALLHFSLAGPPSSAGWACPLRMHHTPPQPSSGARRPSSPMFAPAPPLSMVPLPRLLSLSHTRVAKVTVGVGGERGVIGTRLLLLLPVCLSHSSATRGQGASRPLPLSLQHRLSTPWG
jgi:hypothetical protein